MVKKFDEDIEIINPSNNQKTIQFKKNGSIYTYDSKSMRTVLKDGFTMYYPLKNGKIRYSFRVIDGHIIVRDAKNTEVFKFDPRYAALYVGGKGNEGDIIVRDAKDTWVFHFDAAAAALYVGGKGNDGDIIVRDAKDTKVIKLDGRQAALSLGGKDNDGGIVLRNAKDSEVFRVSAKYADLHIGGNGSNGNIFVRDAKNTQVFKFDAKYAALYVGGKNNEGDIIVNDNDGNKRIHLDGHTGDIKLSGADCAEEFEVEETKNVQPGSVLVINEEHGMCPCNSSYDKKVAGIVSGAGDYKPGIVLDKKNDGQNRIQVALSGKTYCKVDATYSPIEVGDLLTTSPTIGHAMRADDPVNAFGSVIGKALSPLKDGTGLIPVLVSLQ